MQCQLAGSCWHQSDKWKLTYMADHKMDAVFLLFNFYMPYDHIPPHHITLWQLWLLIDLTLNLISKNTAVQVAKS